MKLIELTGDVLHDAPFYATTLVTVPADYQTTGLSAMLDKQYGISRVLNYLGYNQCPDCLYICPCLVLVTERHADIRPTREAIEQAFEILKTVCKHEDIKYIAMPPLFTKYFAWAEVKTIIKTIFNTTEITFSVYFRPKERN